MPERVKAVLLVEDSDDDAFFFERTFKVCRFDNPIVRVATAEDAIAYLKGEDRFGNRQEFPFPSIVFLDLSLPGIHGLEVLKFIRGQVNFPKMLVIVLTGAAQRDLIRESYQLGADSFFSKPCKTEDICNLARAFPEYWIRLPSA